MGFFWFLELVAYAPVSVMLASYTTGGATMVCCGVMERVSAIVALDDPAPRRWLEPSGLFLLH